MFCGVQNKNIYIFYKKDIIFKRMPNSMLCESMRTGKENASSDFVFNKRFYHEGKSKRLR